MLLRGVGWAITVVSTEEPTLLVMVDREVAEDRFDGHVDGCDGASMAMDDVPILFIDLEVCIVIEAVFLQLLYQNVSASRVQ